MSVIFKINIIFILTFFAFISFSNNSNYEMSKKYFANDDLKKSLEFIDKAIEENPDEISFYISKSNILFHLKEFEKSIENLSKIISNNAKNTIANSLLAKFYLYKRNFIEAEIYADKTLSIDKNNILALLIKSQILINEQKYLDAEKYLNHLISLDPENSEAIILKYNVLNALGKEDESMKFLYVSHKLKNEKEFMIKYTDGIEIYYDKTSKIKLEELRLAIKFYKSKSFKKSQKYLELILTKDPENITAKYYYTLVLINSDQYKKSLQYLDQIIKQRKNFVQPYILKSIVSCVLGDHESSNYYISKSKKIAGSHFEIYSSLAFIDLGYEYDALDIIKKYLDSGKEIFPALYLMILTDHFSSRKNTYESISLKIKNFYFRKWY